MNKCIHLTFNPFKVNIDCMSKIKLLCVIVLHYQNKALYNRLCFSVQIYVFVDVTVTQNISMILNISQMNYFVNVQAVRYRFILFKYDFSNDTKG